MIYKANSYGRVGILAYKKICDLRGRLIQEEVSGDEAELVIVTEGVKEYHFKDAINELRNTNKIISIDSIIRQY